MDQDAPSDVDPCLTLRQRSTLPAMVASTSLADAARRSRVRLSTLKRWMKDPAFVYELGRLNDSALGLAHNQLQGLMLRAVANLAHDIDNPNAHIRLSAILMTLHYGSKLSNLDLSRHRGQPGTPHPDAADAHAPYAHDRRSAFPSKNCLAQLIQASPPTFPPHALSIAPCSPARRTPSHQALPSPPSKLNDPI